MPAARRPAAPPGGRALVTGGSGFLGRHLVAALLESGRYADVVVFDIRPCGDARAASVVGDLRDADAVRRAVEGVDVIFHCATASPAAESAANRDLMTGVNVTGTQNVVAAAASAGVPRLVFTSSASVVFDGSDLDGVDEGAPYAARPMDYYTATKIQGEKIVLDADGTPLGGGAAGGGAGPRGGATLRTVALRPSGIFGEHDALLVPVIVEKARAGKSKFIIGGGQNLMDFTYAGNVAHAHLLADAALAAGKPGVAGRPFFITNADPQPFWRFLGDLLEPLGYERPRIRLPYLPLYIIACVVAALKALLRPLVVLPSTDFSPFRLTVAQAQRRLDCSAARAALGYEPQVSVAEGVKRTVAHFAHLAAPGAPVLAGKGE